MKIGESLLLSEKFDISIHSNPYQLPVASYVRLDGFRYSEYTFFSPSLQGLYRIFVENIYAKISNEMEISHENG